MVEERGGRAWGLLLRLEVAPGKPGLGPAAEARPFSPVRGGSKERRWRRCGSHSHLCNFTDGFTVAGAAMQLIQILGHRCPQIQILRRRHPNIQAPTQILRACPTTRKVKNPEAAKTASDTDDNNAKAPHLPVRPTAATTMEHSDSGSIDDDSGSDDDSKSSDDPSQPRRSSSIEPLATKLSSEPAKPQKPDNKKLKVQEASPEHEGGVQNLRPLVWSEEDEVALVRSMVDYYAKKGRVPYASDVDTFREFVKESLSVDASKTQIWDKIRRLKRKHVAAAARGRDGLEPSFSKPHERPAFELSKKIWGPKAVLFGNGCGDEHAEDDAARKHMKIKDEHLVARRQQNHSGDAMNSSGMTTDADDGLAEVEGKYSYPLLRQVASYTGSKKRPAYIAMEAVEMVGSSKAATIKEKYKKLIMPEMKNNFHRMKLLKESVNLHRGHGQLLSLDIGGSMRLLPQRLGKLLLQLLQLHAP